MNEPARLEAMEAQFVPVDLSADLSVLPSSERKALAALMLMCLRGIRGFPNITVSASTFVWVPNDSEGKG
jgi:hypothetical protein